MKAPLDPSEITGQSLGLLLGGHNICRFCHFVDLRPGEQTRVGVLCPHCGKPSKGGIAYFSHTVWILIDLMQEYYHLQGKSRIVSSGLRELSDNHKIAVVLFYCSLGEVLLRHFLEELMIAQGYSLAERERLFDKYRYPRNRAKKLFRCLTDITWAAAVVRVAKGKEIDYRSTMGFYLKVYDARNEFLHKGKVFAIEKSMPADCIHQIWSLIHLFVSIHNYYIPSIYMKKMIDA